jgi:hypothetical protein
VHSIGSVRSSNSRHQIRRLDQFHHESLFPNPNHRQKYNAESEESLNTIWGRKDESDDDDENVIVNAVSSSQSIRLPLEVTPIHYFLEIIPILDNETNALGKIWTAPGNVKILVDALKPEKTITMHALDLNISDVQVFREIRISLNSYSSSELLSPTPRQ